MRCVLICLVWSLLFSFGSSRETLTCPQSIAAGTLTMACSAACPNPLSPCLYFANATDCVADEDSGSICVSSTLSDALCAIECFSPFSGSGLNESWNLLLTDEDEYKRDVVAAGARDPTFSLAKKSNQQLRAIRDLTFPPTTRTISITGDALPIIDKAVDYPVVYRGKTVDVDLNFSFLASATQATTIIMENINLTALRAIPLLPQLTTLQLSNGKLRGIPSGIPALPSLQRLDVSLNTLLAIPSGALPMTLLDLCLQGCELESLPPGIASMTRLKKLDLADNKFSLPAAGSLPLQVEHLIWWGLYHKRLPPDFSSMTKLKKLELGWNDFSNAETLELLPASLEELHLVQAQLEDLSPSFTSLTKLEWIDLSINDLHAVSKGSLPPNLKFLNMSVNWISKIEPTALPTGIETLDLHVNLLTCSSFPSDFATLTRLKTLYLHENQLDRVPPALFSLSSLETLTLHHNPNLTRVTFNQSEVDFLGRLKNFEIDQRCLDRNCDSPAAIGQTGYLVCLTGTTHNSSSSSGDREITTAPNSGVSTGGKPSSSSADNRRLIIGLAVAIGGMVAILIGAVHWRQRRQDAAAGSVMQFPGDDGKGGFKSSVSGAGEVCLIEEELRHGDGATDATAYEEMKSGETHRDTKSTTSRFASTKAVAASASHAAAASQSTTSSTTVVSEEESPRGKKKKVIKKITTTTTRTSSRAADAEQAAVSASSVETGSHISVAAHEELLTLRVDAADVRELQLLSSSQSQEVSLAIHNSRHVVVKRVTRVHSESTSITTSEHRRVVEGIKLHSQLEHPQILELVGVSWTTAHDLQTVCEYMANGDLGSFLASQQPKIEELGEEEDHHWDDAALQIALDVAEALVYLHSLDPPVVHRNLKSRNVLLDEMLRAKITDFGGTQHTDAQSFDAARWIAPELLTDQPSAASAAADIYSLGVIMSELDTWSLPFSDHVGVAESVLLSRLHAGEIQPRFLACSPNEIVALAKKCLARDPTKRPAAAEVADGLRRCLSQFQASGSHNESNRHVHGLAGTGRGSTSSMTF